MRSWRWVLRTQGKRKRDEIRGRRRKRGPTSEVNVASRVWTQ